MQLLLVRHALPLRSEPGEGSDPHLSDDGIAQAARLPDALTRFPITRLVSSPQRRAIQTGEPLAAKLGLPIEIDERLAEYDYGLSHYTPLEELPKEDLQRLIDGHLPAEVDEEAFKARVGAGIDDIISSGAHDDTVALFCHGGVINAVVHRAMETKRLLCVQVDYVGITRVLSSREGRLSVAAANSTEHVWDLLPQKTQW